MSSENVMNKLALTAVPAVFAVVATTASAQILWRSAWMPPGQRFNEYERMAATQPTQRSTFVAREGLIRNRSFQ